MRLPLVLCLSLLPAPILAETIEAPSRVVAVTLYPWGASVVRRVEFSAPAGVHELIVPDLPADSPAEMLRVAAAAGLKVGAVNLASGRLPAPEVEPSPEVQAAEAEVERLQDALRARDAAIAAIRLKVDAANEQWAFVRSFGQARATEAAAAMDPEALRALTRLVGEETLAARQTAHAAEQEALAATRDREDDLEALAEAERALAAITTRSLGRAVLTLAVETAVEGPASLDVTTFTGAAGWRPVYDLRLSRGATPGLEIERSVFVSQASGEDWRGVDLVLSTARPAERNTPSEVWGRLARIENADDSARRTEESRVAGYGGALSDSAVVAELAPAAAPEPVMEAAVLAFQGATVTYRYGNKVDLRDGVEDLRLKLDTLTLDPAIAAVAVPGADATAFLVAEISNKTGQILLPGTAQFFLDGAMVGSAGLPLIAAGAEARLGFGPIEGIRLTRTVPDRTGGSRGLITSRNQIDEVAILTIENLTGEAWPLRVLDQVPYSEQDDLEISYRATPPATETDADGRRGVLAWEFDLGAGESREIRLEHSLKWPDGYLLQ